MTALPVLPPVAYRHCQDLARRHYENFPVASRLLPARIRPAVTAIYAFARSADDLADEGDLSREQRLQGLAHYAAQLDRIAAGLAIDEPLFVAVADSVQRFQLPLRLFHDLLSAFCQDVDKKRYADSAELMDYCRRSANPVGRLLLHLCGHATARNLEDSDAICSALQLINFLQDMQQDFVENGRIYIPLDEMARCGVDEDHFRRRISDSAMLQLFHLQRRRAHALLDRGAPLAWRLPGRIGMEIRLTVCGGMRILQRLGQLQDDVFARPRLTTGDKLWMMMHTLLTRSPATSKEDL